MKSASKGGVLNGSLQHTKALVANHQLDPIQAAATQPLKEVDSACLVLLHALGGAKNLTVAILIHRNRHQNCYIIKLSAPVTAQVDPIHIDIRIPPALQRAVPPIINVDIRFLVQLTDGGRRRLDAPQNFGNILHASDGYSGQVHLNESFFYTAFRRYRSMMAVSKEIPLSLGTFRVTSPEVVVRLRQ